MQRMVQEQGSLVRTKTFLGIGAQDTKPLVVRRMGDRQWQ